MKALVFGGSGFIGSHVAEELLRVGYVVINCDVAFGSKIFGKECYVNITNTSKVNSVFDEYRPDVVFNFAGVAGIQDCSDYPNLAFINNVIGNQNILNRIVGTKTKYIFASSVYVHNDKSGAYGITKRHCEDWIRYYSEKYNFPHSILRFGTIYGPRAGDDNSIKRIVAQALEDKKISYYGTGEEVREYIHVVDAASCAVKAIDSKYDGTVVITGPHPTKARDLIRMLKDILGEGYKMEFRGEKVFDHYEVTPYSFRREVVARKMMADQYYDLGAGLLSVVEDLSYEH